MVILNLILILNTFDECTKAFDEKMYILTNAVYSVIWQEASKIKPESNALTYFFHAKIPICHSVKIHSLFN